MQQFFSLILYYVKLKTMKFKITILATLLIAVSAFSYSAEPFILKQKETKESIFRSVLKEKKSKSAMGKTYESPKFNVKLNLSQLFLTNFSPQFEYSFHKNFSGALSVNFFLPRKVPGLFFDNRTDPTGQVLGFIGPKFSAWGITPEIRFYPGAKVDKQAPHGFYLAPYFRYAKYSISASYSDDYNGKTETFDFKMSYGGFTGGLMIGAQWVFDNHLTFDWWIVGAGAGSAKVTMEGSATGVNLTPAEQADTKKQLETDLGGTSALGLKEPSVVVTSNSFKVTFPGLPMVSYRGLGFCLGYAF